MDFFIQASNPRNNGFMERAIREAQDLSEILEFEVFPLCCEDFFIIWKNSWMRLSYKYSLPYMIQDIILLNNLMLHNNKGNHTVRWGVQEFPYYWDFSWNESRQLKIHSINHSGFANLLNNESEITTTVDSFWAEWKKPLLNCQIAISNCGFQDEEVKGLSDLREIVLRIPRFGVLYESGADGQRDAEECQD